MIVNSDLSACVVFYNPTVAHVNNILSYINYVDRLFIVDNSEKTNKDILIGLKDYMSKIEYIHFGKNMGIGYALNFAGEKSLELKCKWMLTMDQDSVFGDHGLANYFNSAILRRCYEEVGIITPVHATQVFEGLVNQETLVEIKTCMTSGNLLNLNIWNKIGKFEDRFFIDSIDHEYCLRLRSNKYKILLNTAFKLHHALGESKRENFIGVKLTSTNHNYIRRYYMTRNRLFCIAKYFSFDPVLSFKDVFALFKETIKIVLIENNKKKKLRSIYRGVKDFLFGTMGQYLYVN